MKKSTLLPACLLATGLLALPALAANDLFQKNGPNDTRNGFLAASDPVYVKECGSCHFAYSPGLLPARSWTLHMERMGKHFGETIELDPAVRATISRYLTDNAADRSSYEGSAIFMRRLPADETPYRLREVPMFREMHRIMLEVISIKSKIRVRTLTNCNACHQYAPEGSFGYHELFVPGLTPYPRN